MILLQVNNLYKSFGADVLLSNIKLEVQTKDRIALVGRNGAGKSSLLKMIAGQLSFDSGEIIKPKEVEIGYLEQNTGVDSTKTIWEEMLSVFSHLQDQEKQLRKLEEQMADPTLLSNPKLYEKVLQEYDLKQTSFKENGGYQYEADIRSILHGLNFSDFSYDTNVQTLSGGQKTRLALAKLLLIKPHILILDEPTNHLDIETLTWLENYLQNYDGAILIVSHDRYFLDKIINQVYELSFNKIKKYTGNYSSYLDQKAANYEREMKQFEKQQAEVAKIQDFISRNLVRASTTKRAQSRRKQLERMELMDKPNKDEKSAYFTFDIEKQSGNEVLQVNDLSIGYDEKIISSSIKIHAYRGDSIALVGPNGVGKSTLLKNIVGKLEPLNGSIKIGTNVSIGYYDQIQAELTSNKRVLNELWDDYPSYPEKDIRTVLGNFLFSGDDVLKTVSSLSGGQKARLALAKLMMQKCNFLILDEPTNHLDLDSKEILENALLDYPGTLIFVSHDRYFINRIATKVVELSTDGTVEYLGDYDYYVEKKLELEELKQETTIVVEEKKTSDKTQFELNKEQQKLQRQKQRRIEELENLMETMEEEISQNDILLCEPEIFTDHVKVAEINSKNDELRNLLEQYMEEWTSLLEE